MFRRFSKRRGLATLTAILVLGFAFFLAIATCTNCSQILRLSSADTYADRARLTAEAGANDALAQLKISRTWVPDSTYTNKKLPTTTSSTYSLTVTNNATGSHTVVAGDGTSVPAGLVYVISRGLANSVTREVDVMVAPNAGLNPFSYAIFGTSTSQTFELGPGAKIVAYSSTSNSGTYQAQVGANGNITVDNGAKIFGTASSAGTVSVANGGTVTGTTTSNQATVSWPPVTVTPPNGTTVGSLTVGNGQSVTLGPGTYYYSSVTIGSGANLNISTGPVIVYLTGPLSVANGGNINNSTLIPSNFQVYSTSSVSLASGSDLYGAIYAPQGSFTISGGGNLYGSAVASSVSILSPGSKINYDVNLAGLTTPFTGSGSSVVVMSWEDH